MPVDLMPMKRTTIGAYLYDEIKTVLQNLDIPVQIRAGLGD
jgi:hypothetical protein